MQRVFLPGWKASPLDLLLLPRLPSPLPPPQLHLHRQQQRLLDLHLLHRLPQPPPPPDQRRTKTSSNSLNNKRNPKAPDVAARAEVVPKQEEEAAAH